MLPQRPYVDTESTLCWNCCHNISRINELVGQSKCLYFTIPQDHIITHSIGRFCTYGCLLSFAQLEYGNSPHQYERALASAKWFAEKINNQDINRLVSSTRNPKPYETVDYGGVMTPEEYLNIIVSSVNVSEDYTPQTFYLNSSCTNATVTKPPPRKKRTSIITNSESKVQCL